jgi:hypothetical protein
MGCTSLTSIIIPDSVTTIGSYAFWGCTSLTSITIPGSVTSIGSAAFRDCTNLTEINVHTDNLYYMSLEGVLFNKASSILIQYPAGKQGHYAIPDSVTSIGDYAFRRCTSLTSIIIPGSVQTIGQWAFQGCTSLTSIALSSGLQTIGIAAFRECTSLTSITIPESVTSIGSGAFFDCTKLTEINVHPDNQNYMSLEGVLFNKTGSMLIECPAGKQGHYAIPDSVTSIGDYAFRGSTSLTSITMPNSVQIIGDSSFWGCTSLTSITIPGSVRSISHYAFARCSSLTEITFLGLAQPPTGVLWLLDTNPDLRGHAYETSNFPEPGQRFNGLMMGGYFYYEYTITNGQATITAYLNKASIDVTIPATLNGCPVVAIGDNAFQGCSSLTSLTIPGGVTSIGSSPFAGCDNLYGITFLGLTPPTTDAGWMIGTNPDLCGHAYYGSSFPKPGELFNGLMMGEYIPEDYHYTITNGKATITSYIGTSGDVTIPATLGGYPVIAIGDKAFFRQARITSVVMPDSIISIGNNAFERCSGLASVTIPDSVTSIGSNAFSNCSSLTNITIPDGVTSIGAYAFYGCSSLTSVTIPDGVASIGAYTFYGCSSLTRVTLLEGVQTIGDFTFNWCSSLTEITIPNSVTSIGSNAFHGCSALASVTIPDSVTSIGNMAFADCSSLTLITIPRGVTSIGGFAFMGCTTLTEINVHTDNPNYMSLGGVLFNKTGSTLVHYPPGKQDTSYAVPTGVTTIGNGAFATCSALTSITIPGSVTGIGDGAFYECSSLTSITIPIYS